VTIFKVRDGARGVLGHPGEGNRAGGVKVRARRDDERYVGRLSRRAAMSAVACAALVAGFAPSASADPKADLQARAAALRKSIAAVDRELNAAMTRFHAAEDAFTNAIAANLTAEARAREATATRVAAGDAAASRIRALYKSGGELAIVVTVMNADDFHDAVSRYHNANAIMTADRATLDTAADGAREAQKAEDALHEAVRAQARAEREAQKAAERLEELLARQAALLANTDAELRVIIEAEARRARELAAAQMRAAAERAKAAAAAAGVPDAAGSVYVAPGGKRYACPVGAVRSFVDTWHAPRSGGRQHQGTDVFAPYGSPAYAVVDGVIDKWGNGGLGGITLWVRADNGDRYYYAHNSVNIATVGTRVRAGDVIAKVGNTGNAATTPPHIHFEAHPGGGPAQNPYPFLAAICAR
jgi:murein DD-endopeptidase MepM/ murein hydrolase activator NlpD